MASPAIDPTGGPSASAWLGRGLLFVAVVFLLQHARPLLLPVAIAVVFTFVLSPPVRTLRRAGVHEYLGAALVIGAVLGVAVLLADAGRRAGRGVVGAGAADRPPARRAVQRWRDCALSRMRRRRR